MIRTEVNQSQLKRGQKLPGRLVVLMLGEIAKTLRLKKDVFVSVAFVSEVQMRKLNRVWRGKDRETDVLSFQLEEGEVLGEILISYEQARRQAKEMSHTTREEIMFLFVHGILHLFGYDHERPEDAKKMFPLQKRILMNLGIDAQV